MAGLVWLASYPKSGNTWMRLLLGNLLAQRDTPVSINQIELNSLYHVSREIFDERTLLDSEWLTPDETDRLRPLLLRQFAAELHAGNRNAYVKVHDAYRHLADGTPLLGTQVARAALYIVRDPRDVAVSFASFHDLSIDDTITQMANRDFVLAPLCGRRLRQVTQRTLDWSGHVRSWMQQEELPLLLLRYEDLLAEPLQQIERTIRFLGIAATSEQIARAVRFSGFTELKRQEAEHGFLEHQSRLAPFFRSGRAGAWAEVLTTDQAARIADAHGAVMAELGYS